MRRRRVLAGIGGAALLVAIIGARVLAQSTPTVTPLRSIAVDPGTSALVVDEQSGRVFLSTNDSRHKRMSVLDAARGIMLGTVSLSSSPSPGIIAMDAPLHRVLIVPFFFAPHPPSLYVLDGRSGVFMGAMRLSQLPIVMAVDGSSGRAFIINGDDIARDTISILDVAHWRVGRPVFVGNDPNLAYGPDAIAADASTGHVFVANAQTPSLSTFDARTGARLRTVLLPPLCNGCTTGTDTLAVDPQTSRVFIANSESNTVSVLDARSGALVHVIHLGYSPAAVALDTRARRVFVGGTSITVLDARSGALVGSIASFGAGTGMVVDERSSRLFAFGAENGSHTSVAWGWVPSWLRRVVPWIPAPQTVVSRDPPSSPRVGVFDTRTNALLYTVPLSGTGPMAIDQRTGRVFVLSWIGTGPTTGAVVSMLDARR